MSDPRIKPRVPTVNREHPLSRGLVAAWPFQDGGGSILRDVSGKGLDGTLGGTPTWISSSSGGALDFDSGDHVDIGTRSDINVSGSMAVAAWIRPDAGSSSSGRYVVKSNPSTGSPYIQYMLQLNAGTWYFTAAVGGSLKDLAGGTGTVGEWSHVVGVFDNGMRLYVDGVHVAGPSWPGVGVDSRPTWPLSFCKTAYSSASWSTGSGDLQDVRIYSRALSATEVLTSYQDPWSLYRSPEPMMAGTPAAGGLFEFDQLTGGMPDLRGGMV